MKTRRQVGSVLLICGFFLSINTRLPSAARFGGIVLALAGLILLLIGSKPFSRGKK